MTFADGPTILPASRFLLLHLPNDMFIIYESLEPANGSHFAQRKNKLCLNRLIRVVVIDLMDCNLQPANNVMCTSIQ